MSKINEVIMYLVSLAMILLILLTSISSQALNINNYKKAQEKANVSAVMKIPQEEVTEATVVALAYTKGLVDDLVYESKTLKKDIFSQQDKEHMIDVKGLYDMLYRFIISLISIMMLFSTYLIINKRHIGLFNLAGIFRKSSRIFLIVVAGLSLFALTNFTRFWTTFHHLFFDNDLWLMDPRKDALIQMMPESLFFSLVFKIVSSFLAFMAFFNLVAWWYQNFKIKGVHEDD